MADPRPTAKQHSLRQFLQGTPERYVEATLSPKVLITWLHANEPLAPLVAHHIYTKRPDLAAHVDYICGNPRAAAHHEDIGFLEKDLNRCFGIAKPAQYEEKRAALVYELTKQYDYVLDLHCTVDGEFGSGIFLDQDNLDLPNIRKMLAAAPIRRIIAQPPSEHTADSGKSLLLATKNTITLEYSMQLAESRGLPEVITHIERLVGKAPAVPMAREVFYIAGAIPKSEDPGPTARSFELWEPGGYYPILLSDGPRSYRQDPTKEYCCFYAKRIEKIVL